MPLDAPGAGDRRDARRAATRRPGVQRASSPGCRCSPPRPTPRVASPWRRLLQLLVPACWRWRSSCSPRCARPAARSSRWCRSRWPPAGRRSCCSRMRVPLNPMSVTLGALVIAISTEFSVLLSERYRQERADGPRAAEALRAHLPLDRRGGRRLRARRRSPASRCSSSRDIAHAARLRAGHRGRPDGLAARRARRAARGARARRARRPAAGVRRSRCAACDRDARVAGRAGAA